MELDTTQVRVGMTHAHRSEFGVGGKGDAASQSESTVGHAAGLLVAL